MKAGQSQHADTLDVERFAQALLHQCSRFRAFTNYSIGI
jgi:hypothetical protein